MKLHLRHCFLFLVVLCATQVSAKSYDFQKDGVYYLIYGDSVAVSSDAPLSYWGDIVIPPSVEYGGKTYIVGSIDDGAFHLCSMMTSIELPETITRIGDDAFGGCMGLTSITIPTLVRSIGESAFYNCSGLTSVELPEQIEHIGPYLFQYCYALTSVIIRGNVTDIGTFAFQDCISLSSITLPNSLQYIDNYAFQGCSKLQSIVIPQQVTRIGSFAFQGCSSLTSITLPEALQHIELSTFQDCTKLESVTIPNSVISIDRLAFSGCSSLTSITIPGLVSSIDVESFKECTGLKEIEVVEDNLYYASSDGVLYNKEYSALLFCPIGKTSLTIPESVERIGSRAFSYCTGLTSITIPQFVSRIEESAFLGCNGLQEIYVLPVLPPEIKSNTFNSYNYNKPLYVPSGCVTAYQSAEFWSNFKNIQEKKNRYTIEVYSSDNAKGSVQGGGEYDEGETVTLTAIPESGYRFVQWSDGNTENPRQIVVTEDLTLTAEFTEDSGVDMVEESTMRIYVSDHVLHVENVDGNYQVYTSMGQLVYDGRDTLVPLVNAGIYVVRMSDCSRRVVVK